MKTEEQIIKRHSWRMDINLDDVTKETNSLHNREIEDTFKEATLAERERIIKVIEEVGCLYAKKSRIVDDKYLIAIGIINTILEKIKSGSEQEVVSRDALGQCSTTSKTKKLPSEKPEEKTVSE